MPKPKTTSNKKRLVVAMCGASGVYVTRLLLAKSPWPVLFVASPWAEKVYRRECGSFQTLLQAAQDVFAYEDMSAPIASGSTSTVGMVVMPCSANTLGHIANGLGDNLITRAAHCHLKERRPLILGLRETPLTAIDLDNAAKVAAAGGTIMPITPPFYMHEGKTPETVTLHDLMDVYVDRVFSLLGQQMGETWEDIR